MTDEDHGVLYPRYCFHLSPTVNAWAFLRVKEIHALKQYDQFDRESDQSLMQSDP